MINLMQKFSKLCLNVFFQNEHSYLWINFSFCMFRELEKKRTQSSISLSVEKEILRQIAAVKKAKTLNDDAAAAEKAIKDKKVCTNYETELINRTLFHVKDCAFIYFQRLILPHRKIVLGT